MARQRQSCFSFAKIPGKIEKCNSLFVCKSVEQKNTVATDWDINLLVESPKRWQKACWKCKGKKTYAEILDSVMLIQVLLWIADSVFTSQFFPTWEDIQDTSGKMIRDGEEVLWVTKIYTQINAEAINDSGMKLQRESLSRSLLLLDISIRERLWTRVILEQGAKHFLRSLISFGNVGLESGAENSEANHEM